MKRNTKAGERRSAAQMHALASVRREIVLRDSFAARKYLREFTQAFRKYDTALSVEQLEQKIAAAGILLVGDYHALPASQRFAGTLIEKMAPSRPVVLCVEAILSRDQAILDAWWRREINETELRQRLRFDRDWGYSWEPFYDLLAMARDHADAIYGLDCLPRNDMRRIRSRDRHAAAKICDARRQHPNAAIVVLFGESHMAPEHLPRLVKQSLPADSVLTVLQNIDALYWQAVAENAAAVSIDAGSICIFNSSPLEKYESYRLCLERWNGDDQTDFAPAVYNVIFSLARTLGFRFDSPHNGTQPKYLADSLPEVETINAGDEPVLDLPAQVVAGLDTCGCCYFADTNQFFIREFNMAHVAAHAARFLIHACRSGSPSSDSDAELVNFSSQLLCPEAALERGASGQERDLYQSYIGGDISKSAIRKLFFKG